MAVFPNLLGHKICKEWLINVTGFGVWTQIYEARIPRDMTWKSVHDTLDQWFSNSICWAGEGGIGGARCGGERSSLKQGRGKQKAVPLSPPASLSVAFPPLHY